MKTEITVRHCAFEFQFQCPKKWNELEQTADVSIRFCNTCQQNVYLCVTNEQTLARARAGECIAREAPELSEVGQGMVLGRPTVPFSRTEQETAAMEWLSREAGIADSLKNLDATSVCPLCEFPAPDWRVECRVCGYQFGRVPPKVQG